MNTTSSIAKRKAAALALGALLSGAALAAALSTTGASSPNATGAGSHASQAGTRSAHEGKDAKGKGVGRVVKSEAEWKKILTPMQFEVLRQQGTEAPFSGDYHPRAQGGVWRCAGCGLDLFRASTMFDSGTGWPSFWQPIAGHVAQKTDADGQRAEIRCARCDGHLGHVFDDGPQPTGLRYCMNSVAMKFSPDKK
jgi:peptide-methionine (R)-S-oxide reductase